VTDLLVNLYALPEAVAEAIEDVVVRRAFAADKHLVAEFVERNFARGWASECEVSFVRLPVACFVATAGEKICGFACYDATARGFLGPIGIAQQWRQRRIGSALCLAPCTTCARTITATPSSARPATGNFIALSMALKLQTPLPDFIRECSKQPTIRKDSLNSGDLGAN
jgi:hypothetical protein